ncbi:hypothetical protein IMSAG049_01002 [Clostridiales bacterium]|nr:hypothetical protein IMSAG049_01002 [Clostridiales bacterium]
MIISEKYCRELSVYLPLAFVGGFLEIYTYINMSGLFANAQTSNLVMLFNNLCQMNFNGVVFSIISMCLYISGIAMTVLIPPKMKDRGKVWPSLCIVIEGVCIFAVGLAPFGISGRVAALPVFFLTAIQYNTFKSVQGQGVSTVFCTNNIRQAVIHFCKYKTENAPEHLIYMSVYVFVILSFGIGVIAGFYTSQRLEVRAVWICIPILLTALANLHFYGHLLTDENS